MKNSSETYYIPHEMQLSEAGNPLYKQLMAHIRHDISAGRYPAGTRIPPEQVLCETYGVSRVTVRKALSELTKEGLLQPRQGKGTFVGVPKICRDLKNVNSFHDSCALMNRTPGAKVIRAQLAAAAAEDSEKLGVETGSAIVEIVRVRTADDVPVMTECNHFPSKYKYLLDCDLSGSLYALLKLNGTVVSQGVHEISLTYATPSEAHLLDIPTGAALLKLEETLYDADGVPLHTSSQLIRGDRFTFRI